jgi:trigger factor
MEAAYYYGVDGEMFAEIMSGMSLSDYASSVAETATIQAVIFQAIANAENIVISQEEIDTFVKEYVEIYGVDYGFTTVEDFYAKNSTEDVRLMLLQERIIDFISENAKIVEK